MPKEQAQALISELHERFADDQVSPQQKDLMMRLQAHIHEKGDDDPVEPDFLDALEAFIAEIEGEHPTSASVVRQLLDILKNIGV